GRARARGHRARSLGRGRSRRGVRRGCPDRMAGHALPARHRTPGGPAAGGGAASLTTSVAGTVADAVEALAAGGLVVFPTETVYGLGAEARSPDAVERLVAVRGREAGQPSPVLGGEL